MSYDLRWLRLHGLIERLPGTHRYTVTTRDFHLAVFLTRVHHRLLRDGLADILDEHAADNALRHELQRLDSVVQQISRKHRLIARNLTQDNNLRPSSPLATTRLYGIMLRIPDSTPSLVCDHVTGSRVC